MITPLREDTLKPAWLIALVAVQGACALFFFVDVADDIIELGVAEGTRLHLVVELIATLALCTAIIVEVQVILRLLRRKAHLERSVSIARAAVQDVIETHLERWRLTPAEADVANFLIKGLDITEIATLRGSAVGTVKAQLNAIYRKSGTSGRAEVLALILDGLIEQHDDGLPVATGR